MRGFSHCPNNQVSLFKRTAIEDWVVIKKKTFLSASPKAKGLFTRYVVITYGIVIVYSKYNNVKINFLENRM